MRLSKLDYALIVTAAGLLVACGYRVATAGAPLPAGAHHAEGRTTGKSSRPATISTAHTFQGEDLPNLLQGRAAHHERLRTQSSGQTQYWDLSPHPLPEQTSNAHFGWTGQNLKDEGSLRLLANNSRMLARMQRENAWTNKRELVYVNSDFFAEAQLLVSGEQDYLDLPGLDGEVHRVVVPDGQRHFDNPGQLLGAFVGHVDGHPEQSVRAGLCGDTWSVQIFLDPMTTIEISDRPDMSGEWVVSQLDLEKQLHAAGSIPCAEPRTPDDLAQSR